ncbi:MAG: hypothetical protein LBV33_07000 [Lachnospiraceae bacterium]|jgi:hypothetical protein|nr:hypothetical protein [Lachnospiraceae bacterium]
MIEYEEIPLGLSFGLATNMKASAAYGEMGDTERKRLIEAARQAGTKAEMEALVNRLGRGMW